MFKLLRPQFLIAGLFLNVLGAALATHLGVTFDLAKFLMLQLVISSAQLAGAVANEYADVKTDAVNGYRTCFSGGSGEYALGRIGRRAVVALAAFWTCAGMLGALVLTFVLGTGLASFGLMVLGILLALAYSMSPFRLSYRGVGGPAMAGMVSFLAPATSFLVQHGSWDGSVIVLTAPIMFQMIGLMMVVEYPDFEADRVAGKRNLVVRLGRDRAWRLGIMMLVLGAVSGMLGAIAGVVTYASLALALILVVEAAVFVEMERLVRSKPSFFWSTGGTAGFYILAMAVAAAILSGA